MSPIRTSTAGFTLIEMVVCLCLMSLIATVLIEALELAGRSWRQVNQQAADADAVTRAQTFLRQRLESIYFEAQGADQPVGFTGDSDQLEFTASGKSTAVHGRTRYRLEFSAATPGHLDIAYAGVSGLDWSREMLLPGVTALSISFLEVTAKDPPQWVDHWIDRSSLPRLIKIDVAFGPADKRRWPPLYVEPKIDAAGNCVFDIISRRCRSNS